MSFRKFMAESLKKYASDLKFEQDSWDRFAKSLYYLSVDVSKESDVKNLGAKLDEVKDKHGTQGNNIFYLSYSSQSLRNDSESFPGSRPGEEMQTDSSSMACG